MILPKPEELPGLFDRFGIADPGQRRALDLASTTFWDCDPAEWIQSDPNVPWNALLSASWQNAQAVWMALGLIPPIMTWPWPTLERMVGPICPGEVWVVGARTGEGKSSFVANLVTQVAWPGPVRMTVAPLEVKPAMLQVRLACLSLGFSTRVLRGDWWLTGLSEQAARALLHEAVARQGLPPLRDTVRYSAADTLDRKAMVAVIEEAVEWNHRLVVFDHIHHMDHGGGPEHRGIRETMKVAKALATKYGIAILFTAQLNRGDLRDRRRRFYPPELTDLQGGSAIEQIADVVLLLYQPLVPGTRATDIDAVVTGGREWRTVFKPNTVAIKCAKHRVDGSARNQSVDLVFDDGAIRDPAGAIVRGDAYEPAP